MIDEDSWVKQERNINTPINPPNFMNLYESLAFMHNTNLEKQKEILNKLNKIEELIKKENKND